MPPTSPESPERGHTAWVHIEVSMDIDGRLTEYMIEGRPDGGPLSIRLDPVYAGDPIAMLQSVGVELGLRLENCTLKITNDEDVVDLPHLRLMECRRTNPS